MADGDSVTFQSPTTGAIQPVPKEHWDEALNQGYKPVSHKVMYSPDGTRGMVANEEMRDYMKQGYQTTPKTQFEKDRPGQGITTEGMGSEMWEGVKRLGSGALSMIDPTRGLSGAGLSVLGVNPRSGTTSDRLNEVPLVGAAKEAAAGWERGSDPRARLGEAASSGVGSLLGMSGEQASEAANRGEGGRILGQAAVPAATAVLSPLAAEGVGEARPALQRMAYKELPTSGRPTLTPQARAGAMLGGAGAGALLSGGHYIGGHAGLLLGPEIFKEMIGTPELGDIRNPGPFGKVPLRAPRPPVGAPPSPPNPFAGMTPSRGPLGNAPLPKTLEGSPSLFPSKVQMVEKFTPPPPKQIVSPESAPPDYKVTYQSVPQAELRGKVMTGDIEAIREWQRRGLELPPNVRFMVEGDAGTKPWRAYKR